MSDRQTHSVQVGSQFVELPVVKLDESLSIVLMMTIDQGVRFAETAGAEMAALFADEHPEIVAAPATLGIPLAIEVTRSLGLDDYVVLQKTKKIHLADALSAPVRSITTDADQQLLLDRARLDAVAGRRVLLVDDVAATGGSLAAALDLLEMAEADVIGVAVLLTEGDAWRGRLGERQHLVRALGALPVL